MENGPFKDVFPIEHGDIPAIAMLVYQRVYGSICCWPWNNWNVILEPQTTIYKWMFQLDDSKSLYRKWLEITKHPLKNGCLGYQDYINVVLQAARASDGPLQVQQDLVEEVDTVRVDLSLSTDPTVVTG